LRRQAKRHFAAMVADASTGQLGIVASNGARIALDESTPIAFAGFSARTIGELIDQIDASLVANEGQTLRKTVVKNAYTNIVNGCKSIVAGYGIGPVCGGSASPATAISSGELPSLNVSTPSPNPFSESARVTYSVTGAGAGPVDIAVYDIAGREIRVLVRDV